MKKVVSLILVLALILSLGVSALANTTTGSVTITNATIGETYTLYKIFDATISAGTGDQADAVSYSISRSNQFFTVLFGANGTDENEFFEYNATTGTVTKKKGVNDVDLIAELTDMVVGGGYTEVAKAENVSQTQVNFDSLPYGYYLITSSLGTVVTITSNTPNVQVIDKNQDPAPDFKKEIQDGVNADNQPTWGDDNTASIGDKVTYRISFTATNYDGDKKIKYYQIHDEKGDAIWADFESFRVKVGNEYLTCGYYLCQGDPSLNTDNWEFLGTWEGVDEDDRNINDAQWYLVHLGKDQFRITIPWLQNHQIQNGGAVGSAYSLVVDSNSASKFGSPVAVEIIYDAMVEANAAIGTTTHGNRYNKAYASWTSEHETGATSPDEVVTYVYGIGLLKDDLATGVNLAGAKFRVWRDAACTQPVYVIPTDVDGVYIVDDLDTPLDEVTGAAKETPRGVFAAHLAEYLGENTQDNYVVSQVNGKLAILGLAAGTYYLQEVEAPAGYNALTQPVEFVAGEGIRPFTIFADANGNVADIQAEDGVHTEYRLDLTHTVVHNSKGVILPSTGGIGTVLLITVGTLLVIGFAVFLITHKKMSVYKD